jgi:hypothetical protein
MANANQPNIQHHNNVTGWAGWIAFASFVLALTGIYHIILGIGGVLGQDWYLYSSGQTFWFDSSAWGWTMIVGGVILLLTSYLLAVGNMVGRIVATIVALASLIANISLFSVAPVWSLIAIILDVMVIYAVTAHGREMKDLYRE